jgi:hypothetical protein
MYSALLLRQPQSVHDNLAVVPRILPENQKKHESLVADPFVRTVGDPWPVEQDMCELGDYISRYVCALSK